MKCELSSQLLEKVRQKLQGMDFTGVVHNQDIYYDTPTWELLRKAVFLRVRNNSQIEFKFNEDLSQEHGLVNERSFPLHASPTDLKKINALFARFLSTWIPVTAFQTGLKENGLKELVRIDNRRETYTDGRIVLSIDHVEGLGDFLEVETQCQDESDTSLAQAQLQAFVADLNVEHIKVGYVELWLYKHNPEAYKAGRYHLS
ncbi:CYTH domain-containing protein [Ktedonosporobacter rubrisoli]|uniref:CYTH domain-containing protein n=1 Tax=Ktedonosporobacter rubrisoli TaxID=2509675 RepID=A0A4P6K5W4_KTERU|nr:CYTH domain-containing protein [Ktedonosporobacter rubrisoli]